MAATGVLAAFFLYGQFPYLALTICFSWSFYSMDPNISYSIKPTQFDCNSGVTNAIPDEATIIWDVRAEKNDIMATLLIKAKQAIENASLSMGAAADVSWYNLVPAAVYTDDAIALYTEAIEAVLGKKGICDPGKTAGGEDFHNFILQKPHLHAYAAQQDGTFAREIVPHIVHKRKGDVVVDKDEFIRPNCTAADLAKLRPAFIKDGTVTAGNASGINDGAAALVIMSADKAKELGLKPLAKILSWASAGVEPAIMYLTMMFLTM